MDSRVTSGVPKSILSSVSSSRWITITGTIVPETADKVLEQVLDLNAKTKSNEVVAIIDSNGGEFSTGLDIYDLFRLSPAPVWGLVLGQAHSAAFMALQGCRKRVAARNSRLLIHNPRIEVRSSFEFDTQLSDVTTPIEALIARVREHRERSISILLERTQLGRTELEEVLKRGKTMSAEEALTLGFIDEIC